VFKLLLIPALLEGIWKGLTQAPPEPTYEELIVFKSYPEPDGFWAAIFLLCTPLLFVFAFQLIGGGTALIGAGLLCVPVGFWVYLGTRVWHLPEGHGTFTVYRRFINRTQS
jgi:hypothetical protein